MATMFHNIVNALVYSDDLMFVLFSFIYLFIYLFISSFFWVCVHQSQCLDNQQLNTSMIQRKTHKNAILNK